MATTMAIHRGNIMTIFQFIFSCQLHCIVNCVQAFHINRPAYSHSLPGRSQSQLIRRKHLFQPSLLPNDDNLEPQSSLQSSSSSIPLSTSLSTSTSNLRFQHSSPTPSIQDETSFSKKPFHPLSSPVVSISSKIKETITDIS